VAYNNGLSNEPKIIMIRRRNLENGKKRDAKTIGVVSVNERGWLQVDIALDPWFFCAGTKRGSVWRGEKRNILHPGPNIECLPFGVSGSSRTLNITKPKKK